MTDQPHTPTTEQVRLDYVMAYTDRESSQILAEQSFDRWHAAEIAAAEQRGAVKALLEAAESKSLIDYMYTNLHVNQPAAVREAAKYLHNRADLLEGDDETH